VASIFKGSEALVVEVDGEGAVPHEPVEMVSVDARVLDPAIFVALRGVHHHIAIDDLNPFGEAVLDIAAVSLGDFEEGVAVRVDAELRHCVAASFPFSP